MTGKVGDEFTTYREVRGKRTRVHNFKNKKETTTKKCIALFGGGAWAKNMIILIGQLLAA